MFWICRIDHLQIRENHLQWVNYLQTSDFQARLVRLKVLINGLSPSQNWLRAILTNWHSICVSRHAMWHFVWYSIWHAIWHTFWHFFFNRHSICQMLWHAILRHWTWHLVRDFLTYIMLYIPSDPSDIVSDMLSHIYSDILSDIVSHSISHILSDIIFTKQFI